MAIVDAIRWTVRIAVLALIGMTPSMGLAASGTALGVDPQAEAQTAGVVRVLTVGDGLEIGDTVRTGPKGQVQIKFADETELVVGPNSVLTIEDYLIRGDNSAGKLAINALAGTFRFATGLAQKDRYLITTPTGTIGVRGTGLDWIVDALGTHVLLFHGAVRLCNLQNVCVTLDGTCEIGEFDTTDSQIIGPSSQTTGEQRAAWKELFQYAEDQSTLINEFWFEQARECFNAEFKGNDTESLVKDEDDQNCPVYQGEGFLAPQHRFDLFGDDAYRIIPADYYYVPEYDECGNEIPA